MSEDVVTVIFLRKFGVSQTYLHLWFFIDKRLWFLPSTSSKICPHSQNCLLLNLSAGFIDRFEDVFYLFQKGNDFLWNVNITMGKTRETNKKKSRTKLHFQPTSFSPLSPDIFESKIKIFSFSEVYNDKPQLVVLVVSFGENLYLREVSH